VRRPDYEDEIIFDCRNTQNREFRRGYYMSKLIYIIQSHIYLSQNDF
jgi:hypothetical protein